MEEEFEEREAELPPPKRALHIKKRALKNKSLAVSFDEKNLRDYVTGFHKRKKKRRKEAQKQQEEVLRRKRIEARKKRKAEREFVLYGGAPPTSSESDDNEANGSDEDYHSDGEEGKPSASVNETKTYDGTDIKVTVTTSEIFREDEAEPIKKTQLTMPKSEEVNKKQNLGVSKKKSFKKVSIHKARGKPRNISKRDKKKGKKKGNTR